MKMQNFLAGVLTLAAVGNLVLSPVVDAAARNSLTVTVSGLRNQKGRVCFSLFADSQGFPSSNSRALQSRCITAVTPAVTFNNLNEGSYAVAVFHDEDGDGVLKRNFLGIPKQGFGFSRNPGIFSGPPSFEDTAVSVKNQSTKIQIQLKYF